MKHTTIGIIILMLMLPLVSAIDLEQVVEQANDEAIGQSLPGPMAFLFGNEEINIHIENGEITNTIGIVTEDKMLKSITLSEVTDPSLNVYTTEETIVNIVTSSDPAQKLGNALNNEDITYNAVGFFNKIKFAILDMFVGSFIEAVEANNAEDSIGEDESEVIIEGTNDVKDDDEETNLEEPAEPTGPTTHIVQMTSEGFEPDELNINAGDAVEWKNERSGKLTGAMIIGTRTCREVRSKVLKPGESYMHTFEESENCVIADGIMTTKESKIVVE